MAQPVTNKKAFSDGLVVQNPVLIQFLGMCSVLAISTELTNAIGMGLGVIFVLVMSNVVVSLIRKLIPDSIRIPVFIVIIASLVTVLEMFMNAFLPDLAANLGTFLALITVNCIILGRAEAFASKHNVGQSALDGLGMGIGYTLSLCLISFIRGLLGNGSIKIFSLEINNIIPASLQIPAFVSTIGAFVVLGVLVSQVNRFRLYMAEKKANKAKVEVTE